MSLSASKDRPDAARGRASQVRGLPGALWRGRMRIAVFVLAAAVTAALWLATTTPLYRSSAQVLIESQWQTYTADQGAEGRLPGNGEAARGQMQLILSRDLGRQVIERLDLAGHADFERAAGGPFSRLLASVGIFRGTGRLSPEEQVLARFQERLSVTAVDGGRILSIGYVSSDPALAASIANAVADGYVDMQRDAVAASSREAPAAWLSGEIETLRGSVAEAERRAEEYRREHNLTAARGSGRSVLSGQELSELTSQLATVRSERSAARARARTIREMLEAGVPLEASEILDSPRMQRLAEQEARARAQLAELSSTLGPMHPRMRGLNAELADLRRQSREEAERIARMWDTDAQMAAASEDELRQAVERLRQETGGIGEQELQLRLLEEEAESQRQILRSMLARAGTAAGAAAAPITPRILARATPAGAPFHPQVLPVLLLAMLGAAILGGVVTVMRAPRESRSESRPDVPEAVVSPAAGLSASLEVDDGGEAKAPARARSSRAFNAANAGLEAIAHAIAAPTDGAARVVLATSSRRMPEVAEVAMALARMSARDGARRVVLLDTRFNEPLQALKGMKLTGSLADLIAGKCSFDDALMRDPGSRVHVIAAGASKASPLALVSSDRMETIVDALSQTYDAVVVVAPPLSRHAELRVLGQLATLGVMANRHGDTETATALARERLGELGLEDVAVVTVVDATAPTPDRVARAA